MLPTRIVPDAFRRMEDAFLGFVRELGWEADRNDVLDERLRRRLRAARDLRGNDPDIWVLPPWTPVLYVDVKALSAHNATSPFQSIELRSVGNSLASFRPWSTVESCLVWTAPETLGL